MLFLGVLKELNNVLFKLSSDESLAPATVMLVATDEMGFSEEVTMARGDDDRHFQGIWDTQVRALGVAHANASAEDLAGNPGAIAGDLDLISSYGRRYGQDYGHGF